MKDNGWIVLLILAGLVGGVNLLMYGIVRGAFRPQNKDLWSTLGKTLNISQKKEDDLGELRRKVEDLENNKK